MQTDKPLDAAQIGRMFVRELAFTYVAKDSKWDGSKQVEVPAHWSIRAKLTDKLERYASEQQTMTIEVDQGIGQRLAEILVPVVIADASRKAQQLADDSRAMLTALGDTTLKCLANPAGAASRSETSTDQSV